MVRYRLVAALVVVLGWSCSPSSGGEDVSIADLMDVPGELDSGADSQMHPDEMSERDGDLESGAEVADSTIVALPICDNAIVANPGFELPVGTERPQFWRVGFLDEELGPEYGTWDIDDSESFEGEHSLRLQPTGLGDGLFLSQVLHMPPAALEGSTINVSFAVKSENVQSPPIALAIAVNPEVEDPQWGPGVAAIWVGAGEANQDWKELSGSFTIGQQAAYVFLYLSAQGGSGTVWYDDVKVEGPQWSLEPVTVQPAQGFIPVPLEASLGFVASRPMDISEKAVACQMSTGAALADWANVFFQVRWCRLNQDSCATDSMHGWGLEQVKMARDAGLGIVLTLDFTHQNGGDVNQIGELNPLPDGSLPGALSDPVVREALRDEFLWLVEQVQPEMLLVGIETNILYLRHPDWWPDYVLLLKEVYQAVKEQSPKTHVTAYHTIDWSMNDDGTLNEAHAAIWRQLLPWIDSVAYSTYPNSVFQSVDQIPDGYFSGPSAIAPELPLVLPEFGMTSGGSFTPPEQQWVLQRILEEIVPLNPEALIWYQIYDDAYLGLGAWAQDLFSAIGFFDGEGRPKPVLSTWLGLG